jgi:hypothetical protein
MRGDANLKAIVERRDILLISTPVAVEGARHD